LAATPVQASEHLVISQVPARVLAQGFVARLAHIDTLAAARCAPLAKIVTAQRAFHYVRDSKDGSPSKLCGRLFQQPAGLNGPHGLLKAKPADHPKKPAEGVEWVEKRRQFRLFVILFCNFPGAGFASGVGRT